MRETLLIIDGRGYPETLVSALEAAGYFCVYARGPIKARALLSEHVVAAIVWKDNTANLDLSLDLARVWRSHPHIPVVHLFAHGMRAVESDLGSQVRISLPAEAPEAVLLAKVGHLLAPRQLTTPSELDFRGVAAGGHADQSTAGQGFATHEPGWVHAPPTGLSLNERKRLLAAVSPVQSAWWNGPWLWLRSHVLRPRTGREPHSAAHG